MNYKYFVMRYNKKFDYLENYFEKKIVFKFILLFIKELVFKDDKTFC